MEFVPESELTAWHERAMDAAKGGDLHSLIGLFRETKEMKRLAELVRGVTESSIRRATTPPSRRRRSWRRLSQASPPASGVPKECAS